MDILAGGMVGISQVLIGHPLDTMKVLLQNKQSWRTTNYYRGSFYPFVCSTIANATIFPVYNRCFEYTESHFVSGAVGGLLISPIVHLFDVAKIKRQTNQSIDWKTKGIHMSCLRESVAVSLYFGTYESLKQHGTLFAGGMAGISSWLFTYPIDTIRSRQISQNKTFKHVSKASLWKGLSVCLVRACLVNSVSFYVYNMVK